ncbi:hypothetical protein ACFQFR_35435 [Streptomyces goshikiensis]
MPADLVLPPGLVGKVFHDPSALTLCSRGHRSQDEIEALAAASGEEDFQRAARLLQGAQSEPVEQENRFLDESHAGALFDHPLAPPPTASPSSCRSFCRSCADGSARRP